MTLKHALTLIILIPVTIILLFFIVANRTPVTMTLWPISSSNHDLTLTAPFFVWIFCSLLVGILIGAASIWFTQYKYRWASRQYRKDYERCMSQSHQNTPDSNI